MRFHHAVACLACSAIGDVEGNSASFKNSFTELKLCSRCGSRDGWRDTVVVWIPAWKWLNPLTWGRGEWIE